VVVVAVASADTFGFREVAAALVVVFAAVVSPQYSVHTKLLLVHMAVALEAVAWEAVGWAVAALEAVVVGRLAASLFQNSACEGHSFPE